MAISEYNPKYKSCKVGFLLFMYLTFCQVVLANSQKSDQATYLGLKDERNNLTYFNYKFLNTKMTHVFETLPQKYGHHQRNEKTNCKVQLQIPTLMLEKAQEITLCLFREHWEEDVVENMVVQIQGMNQNMQDYEFMDRVKPVTGYVLRQPASLVSGYIINSHFYGQVRLLERHLNHFIVFYIEPLNMLPLYNESIKMDEIDSRVREVIPDANAIIFEYLMSPQKATKPLMKPPTQKPMPPSNQKPTPSSSQKPTPPSSLKPTSSTSQKPTPPSSLKPTSSTSQKPTPSSSQKPTPPSTQKPTASSTQKSTPPSTQKPTPSSTQKSTPPSTQKPTPSSTQKSTPPTTQKSTPPSTQKPTPSSTQKSTPPSTQNPTPSSTQKSTPPSTQKPTPSSTQKSSLPSYHTPAPPTQKPTQKPGLTPSQKPTPPSFQNPWSTWLTLTHLTVTGSPLIHSTTLTSKHTMYLDLDNSQKTTKPPIPIPPSSQPQKPSTRSITETPLGTLMTSQRYPLLVSTQSPAKDSADKFLSSSAPPPPPRKRIIYSSTLEPSSFAKGTMNVAVSSTLPPKPDIPVPNIVYSSTIPTKPSIQNSAQSPIVLSSTPKAKIETGNVFSTQSPEQKPGARRKTIIHSSTLPTQKSGGNFQFQLVHSTTTIVPKLESLDRTIVHSTTHPTVPTKELEKVIIHSTTSEPILVLQKGVVRSTTLEPELSKSDLTLEHQPSADFTPGSTQLSDQMTTKSIRNYARKPWMKTQTQTLPPQSPIQNLPSPQSQTTSTTIFRSTTINPNATMATSHRNPFITSTQSPVKDIVGLFLSSSAPPPHSKKRLVYSTTSRPSLAKFPTNIMISSTLPQNQDILGEKDNLRNIVYSSIIPTKGSIQSSPQSPIVLSTTPPAKMATSNDFLSTPSPEKKPGARRNTIIHSSTLLTQKSGGKLQLVRSTTMIAKHEFLDRIVVHSTTQLPVPKKELEKVIIHSTTLPAVRNKEFEKVIIHSTTSQPIVIERKGVIHSTTLKPEASKATYLPSAHLLTQLPVQSVVHSTTKDSNGRMSVTEQINVHSTTLIPVAPKITLPPLIYSTILPSKYFEDLYSSQNASTFMKTPNQIQPPQYQNPLTTIFRSTTVKPPPTLVTSHRYPFIVSTQSALKDSRGHHFLSSSAAPPHSEKRIVYSTTSRSSLGKIPANVVIRSTLSPKLEIIGKTKDLRNIVHSSTIPTKATIQNLAQSHIIIPSSTPQAKLVTNHLLAFASTQTPEKKHGARRKTSIIHSSTLPTQKSGGKLQLVYSTTIAPKLNSLDHIIVHSTTQPAVPKKDHEKLIIHSTTSKPIAVKQKDLIYSTTLKPEVKYNATFKHHSNNHITPIPTQLPVQITPGSVVHSTTEDSKARKPARDRINVHSTTLIPAYPKATRPSLIHSTTLRSKKLETQHPKIIHSTTQTVPKPVSHSKPPNLLQSVIRSTTSVPIPTTAATFLVSSSVHPPLNIFVHTDYGIDKFLRKIPITLSRRPFLVSTQAPERISKTNTERIFASTLTPALVPPAVIASTVHPQTKAPKGALFVSTPPPEPDKNKLFASTKVPLARALNAQISPIEMELSGKLKKRNKKRSEKRRSKHSRASKNNRLHFTTVRPRISLNTPAALPLSKNRRKRRHAGSAISVKFVNPKMTPDEEKLLERSLAGLEKRQWRFPTDLQPKWISKTSRKRRDLEPQGAEEGLVGGNLLVLNEEDDTVEDVLFPKGPIAGPFEVYNLDRSDSLVCKLCMWLQPSFANKFGFQLGVEYGAAEMIDLVRYMNWILRPIDFNLDFKPENIGFGVGRVIVSSIPEIESVDPEEWKLDAIKLVPQLSKLFTQKFGGGCCAILAFMDRNIAPFGTLAYRRSMCVKEKNFALISGSIEGKKVAKYDIYRLAMHALGHLMGSFNDDIGDRDCIDKNPSTFNNPFIMHPTHQLNVGLRPNSMRISYCTRMKVGVYLASSRPTCLEPSSRAFCGNGILEPGEECDCGSPWQCQYAEECCGMKDSFNPCKFLKMFPSKSCRLPQIMESDLEEFDE